MSAIEESRIAAMLADRAAEADDLSDGSGTLSPAGRQTSKPAISPSPSPTQSTSPTPGLGLHVVPCSTVPKPPGDTEVDTWLAREEGYLEWSFFDGATQKDLSFTIAFRTDPTCQDRPWLKRLIDDTLAAGR